MPITPEKTKSKKSESRNNVLYLILTLKNHSDRNNPLSISEIAEHINKDYTEQCGGNINYHTVGRLLDSLENSCPGLFRIDDITTYSTPEDIHDDNHFGFYLRHIIDVKKSENCKTAKISKYYYESILLESELMTLYDAIETYNYFAVDDIMNISLKLSSLRPLSKNMLTYRPSRADDILKEDKNVLDSISYLAEIISHKNLAGIDYGTYAFDPGSSKIELIRKKGYPKVMLPLRLIWSNGFYYCIMGNSEYDNTVNLRVDRMLYIEEIDAKSSDLKKYSGFGGKKGNTDIESKSAYRAQNPVMYSGEPTHFKLLVRSSMINTMVDVFGKNIKPEILSIQDQNKLGINDPSSEWLKIRIDSSMDGMMLFAKEYSGDVIILSPEEVRMKVRNLLKAALNDYS